MSVEEPDPAGPGGTGRPALAAKALSDGFGRLRYRDASLLIWQQQQLELRDAPPASYLRRSRSAWYSSYGNQAVLVRNQNRDQAGAEGSRICAIM